MGNLWQLITAGLAGFAAGIAFMMGLAAGHPSPAVLCDSAARSPTPEAAQGGLAVRPPAPTTPTAPVNQTAPATPTAPPPPQGRIAPLDMGPRAPFIAAD